MNKPCILIVDDSNTNIVLLEAILEEGYFIQTAVSAKEAADCILKRLPDLILLDLLMPKISGFDFLEMLREDEKTQHIPVIVISAVADDDSINRILDLGAAGYIQKPVNIQQLIERVASVLPPSGE